ncbi:MmgE/PrpD family protein [Alcaligenaceae bacterium]|nr:MmgE/PrpD family protein [Alcaligenaceae bacterium]
MNMYPVPARATESSSAEVTRQLASAAAALQYEDLSAEAVEIVKQCVLDTIGVAIAGHANEATRSVYQLCADEGAAPAASFLCLGVKGSVRQAALVNGTAAHALDFDDCCLTMPGHVSAVVLPAVLALGERYAASGKDLITAFAAGFEAGCSLGAAISPGHYDAGFHATGTNGAVAAAAGAARLLGLPADQTADALSIAATTAAGLKGLFGTPCKPFHAGKAAENGVQAALLAQKGFVTRRDAIECRQGYAMTHSPDFNPERVADRPQPGGMHLFDNLFKYHAACYGTHGAIECAIELRGRLNGNTADIERLVLEVAQENDKTCNIAAPANASEARFSLCHTIAMVLCGHDTGMADDYGETSLGDAEVVRIRQHVDVRFFPARNIAHSRLTVALRDGSTLSVEMDAGKPNEDLAYQRQRLQKKFLRLTTPIIGEEAARALVAAIDTLESSPAVGELAAKPAPVPAPSGSIAGL